MYVCLWRGGGCGGGGGGTGGQGDADPLYGRPRLPIQDDPPEPGRGADSQPHPPEGSNQADESGGAARAAEADGAGGASDLSR